MKFKIFLAAAALGIGLFANPSVAQDYPVEAPCAEEISLIAKGIASTPGVGVDIITGSDIIKYSAAFEAVSNQPVLPMFLTAVRIYFDKFVSKRNKEVIEGVIITPSCALLPFAVSADTHKQVLEATTGQGI